MKNRIAGSLALVAAAGLALSACTPPHENASDAKVDTATSQNADSLVGAESSSTATTTSSTAATTSTSSTATTATTAASGETVMFVDCVGEPTREPTEVSTDCSNPAAVVTDVEWDSWTAQSAEGTGTNPDGSEAEIRLTNPSDNGTETVFTQVTVDGLIIAS